MFGQKTAVADEKPPQVALQPKVAVDHGSSLSDSDEFDLTEKKSAPQGQPEPKPTHHEVHKKKKRTMRQKPRLQVDSSLSDSFLDKMGQTDFKKKAQQIVDDDSLFDD